MKGARAITILVAGAILLTTISVPAQATDPVPRAGVKIACNVAVGEADFDEAPTFKVACSYATKSYKVVSLKVMATFEQKGRDWRLTSGFGTGHEDTKPGSNTLTHGNGVFTGAMDWPKSESCKACGRRLLSVKCADPSRAIIQKPATQSAAAIPYYGDCEIRDWSYSKQMPSVPNL